MGESGVRAVVLVVWKLILPQKHKYTRYMTEPSSTRVKCQPVQM